MFTYINIVIDDEKFIICDFSIVVHIFKNKTYFTELKFMHHVIIKFSSENLKCKKKNIICFKLIVNSVINILTLQNIFYMLLISFNIVFIKSL